MGRGDRGCSQLVIKSSRKCGGSVYVTNHTATCEILTCICFPQPTYRLAVVGLLIDWRCEYHDCSFWSSDVRRRGRTIITLNPTNISEGMLLKRGGGGRWKRRGKKKGKEREMKGKDEGRGGGGRKRKRREKKGERGKQHGSQKTKEKRRTLAPQTNSLLVSSGMQKRELVVSAHPSVFGQQLFCVVPKNEVKRNSHTN